MKTKHKLFLFMTFIVIIIALPMLSPMIFTNSTEKGAIRKSIYQEGYPYQSYFAILKKRSTKILSMASFMMFTGRLGKVKQG